ncbi:MAG: hypothetical protein R3C44_24500 [Chloroflexota bacterium]
MCPAGDIGHALVIGFGRFLARRPGEGIGFEGRGGCVAGVVAFAEPCAQAQRPEFVRPGVEDAEEVVVVA